MKFKNWPDIEPSESVKFMAEVYVATSLLLGQSVRPPAAKLNFPPDVDFGSITLDNMNPRTLQLTRCVLDYRRTPGAFKDGEFNYQGMADYLDAASASSDGLTTSATTEVVQDHKSPTQNSDSMSAPQVTGLRRRKPVIPLSSPDD
ncbi:hypothetical protein CALVIDRAFT_563221 [Calocera viscosa TUFC12733]|uniref:Uncharacterized protein n=1 Tax=Calocera viscosa (strain TUFC12733) TaxID=1330018 RepID=A0A167MRK6_CALVF|nr:hypothetical protein CALVIDRAFT_563221 [Calocera viscosa TUFC12733]